MTNYNIIKAYNATDELAENKSLPVSSKWDIFELRKGLLPHIEFVQEQQAELLTKYNGKVNDQGGFSFEDQEDAKQFAVEYEELLKFDKDVSDLKKPVIPIDSINVHTMETLSELVNFIK